MPADGPFNLEYGVIPKSSIFRIPKLWDYAWFISIFRLFFAPNLFSINSMSFPPPFISVPRFLFLLKIDQFHGLVKTWQLKFLLLWFLETAHNEKCHEPCVLVLCQGQQLDYLVLQRLLQTYGMLGLGCLPLHLFNVFRTLCILLLTMIRITLLHVVRWDFDDR